MRRFADLFIAICIPVVAASAGAIAYWHFDATAPMAGVHAATVLLALVLIRSGALARRRRREEEDRIAGWTRRLGLVAGSIESIERRLAVIEDGGVGRKRREEIDQLVAEVEVIGTLTRQVIETVADLEVQFAETRSALIRAERAPAPRPNVAAEVGTNRRGAVPVAPIGPRSPLVPERFAHLDEDTFLALVRGAIESDRIDLHLQPIVTLPQRKIRFYEALTRLRCDDGEVIHPSDYIPIAEARGYVAQIDEQILIRSLAILRRLGERSREVGVFLNLSAASLAHPGFFGDFLKTMERSRDLADMLVLEFPQNAVRSMGPIEHEGLRALYDLGFRFSVDQVGDLKTSFQNLSDRGFRYAKISADRLLHRSSELGTDIHPVDLTDYFRRFGMELIADHLEKESDVIDVLDYGVRLGQGFVFAPPRPIRLDPALVARVAAAPAPAPAVAPTPPVVPATNGRSAPPAPGRAGPGAETRRETTVVPADARPRGETSAMPAEPRARGEAASAPASTPAPRTSARPAPQAATAAARKPAEGEAPRPGIRILPAKPSR